LGGASEIHRPRLCLETEPKYNSQYLSFSTNEMDSWMNRLQALTMTLAVAMVGLGLGCRPKSKPTSEKQKPARVDTYPNETDVYRVTLTPQAEQRLQIRTERAKLQSVARTRDLGGLILIPDGQRIPVTAPLAGTLSSVRSAPQLIPGTSVSAHQQLFELTPIMRPDLEAPGVAERVQMANANAMLISAQVQAAGDTEQAKAQVEGAKINFERARKLLADRAGSQRDVDNTEVALNVAMRALEAASQRKAMLDKVSLEINTGKVPIVSITAPTDGTIQTVMARVGQVVSIGAPLLEIVDLRHLWIRVPVYAGQLHEIDILAATSMTDLSQRFEQVPIVPVPAPPTADPISASIDIYYQLDNCEGRFHPGERVSVKVPLKGEAESLVIPRASVIRDIHGIAWVYIKTGEHEFRRERVEVRFTTKELSILQAGLSEGTEVVVDGAAELFGTEFGTGK
jgi:membrane fusion protein, heavy metal efflux system